MEKELKRTLLINGSIASTETIAGWQAESYVITDTSRSSDQHSTSEPIEPDAVLELELANGMRILVSAEDSDRYLGSSTARGIDSSNIIKLVLP